LVLAFPFCPAGGIAGGFCFTDCAVEERGLVQSAHEIHESVKLLLARALKTQAGCILSVGSLDTVRGILFSCSLFVDSAVLNCFLSFYRRQKVIPTSQLLLALSDSSAGVSSCNSINVCSRKFKSSRSHPCGKEKGIYLHFCRPIHVLSRNFN